MSKETLCEACGRPIHPPVAFVGSDPVSHPDGSTHVYSFAWHPECGPREPRAIEDYVNRKARELARQASWLEVQENVVVLREDQLETAIRERDKALDGAYRLVQERDALKSYIADQFPEAEREELTEQRDQLRQLLARVETFCTRVLGYRLGDGELNREKWHLLNAVRAALGMEPAPSPYPPLDLGPE